MILADTSIWVDHLRRPDPLLSKLLDAEKICSHPYVLGEIAMGSLGNRSAYLAGLRQLPFCPLVPNDDVLALVEEEHLFGLGIGLLDAHLLASSKRTPGTQLWTRYKRLRQAARALAVEYTPA